MVNIQIDLPRNS